MYFLDAFIFLPIVATNLDSSYAFWTVAVVCVVCASLSLVYFVIAKFWPSEWCDEVEHSNEEEEIKKQTSWIKQFLHTFVELPWRFWLICIADMCAQGAIWPFVAFSPDFFYRHYGFTPEVAGMFATILAGIAIPLGIVVGFIGGKIPRALIGMNAAILQIVCFLMLAWTTEVPCIIAVLGLSIVLASTGTSVYAPVSQMVPHDHLGMALGILKSAESISWLITPPLYGAIYEWTHNFAWSCTLFAAMGIVCFLVHFILFVVRDNTKVEATELSAMV